MGSTDTFLRHSISSNTNYYCPDYVRDPTEVVAYPPHPKKYKLAVLRFPGDNAEHPASSGWVIAQQPKWLADPRISSVLPLRRSDTPITMVRNLLVKTALEQGADYILMIDSDMSPDIEPDGKPFWDTSWAFMMERRAKEQAYMDTLYDEEHKRRGLTGPPENTIWKWENFPHLKLGDQVFKAFPPATIAAPYCGPPPHEPVYVMRFVNGESNAPDVGFTLEMFARDQAAAFAGIMEVGALATGLILYDARVFKRLPPPWFDYEYDEPYRTRKTCTEDIFQTRNAKCLGMPQFVNWDAWAGHVKLKTVRKPRPYTPDSIPNVMADAIKRGIMGNHKVVIVSSPDDAIIRPSTV